MKVEIGPIKKEFPWIKVHLETREEFEMMKHISNVDFGIPLDEYIRVRDLNERAFRNFLVSLHSMLLHISEKRNHADINQIKGLLQDALYTDGAYHKQWYLEQIGKAYGLDIEQLQKEGGWNRGIAP